MHHTTSGLCAEQLSEGIFLGIPSTYLRCVCREKINRSVSEDNSELHQAVIKPLTSAITETHGDESIEFLVERRMHALYRRSLVIGSL